VIKAGPLNANISAIEIYGAKTSASSQNIRLFTKNTERVRVASNGNVGIANTSPTDRLTVGGAVRVIGSNAFTMGTETNYMKAFSDVIGTQTKIESRVGTGKGLNFYTSTTDTMGNPKMTILENSNVGVGTATPQGLLHTSGGTVFINNQVVNSGGFSHLGAPLVVTNTLPIQGETDQGSVMHLTREGVGGTFDGVRATFKIGKHDDTSLKSKTKLDIYLTDENYTDEKDILTLQSDGRVGIGSTNPRAHLEVIGTGIANPLENGILVHNQHGSGQGDAIIAAQTDLITGNTFTSYIQSSQNSGFRGWSVGVTGERDFRITRNEKDVSDSINVGLYIDGTTRDVGIGTDVPRAKLEVNGNVVIGNQLTFGGVSSDEFGNTFITERLYDNLGKSELVIFKGNDRTGTAAPDRIRSIAAEHLFQTYNTTLPSLSTNQIQSALLGDGSVVSRAMTITPSGVVVIGALPLDDQGELDVSSATRFYVGGGLEFAQDQSMKFGALDIFTAAVGPVNLIESIGNAPLVFRQKVSGTSTEYARFTNEGLVGFGTNSPDTNVHIYSDVTTDIDVLKLQSPGTNNKIGGFSNTQHSVHGTVLGAVNNSVEVDGIHIIDSGNVGIGTVNPSERFTVYNSKARLEHSSADAMLEFKTPGGVSNIYGDVTGNVVIDAVLDVVINSNVEIAGDLQIDGKIDLGNQVAIDLGGVDATTALQVGGGFISGSNEVACKRYSKQFSITTGGGQDVQLNFGPETFYAKIVAQLRETSRQRKYHDTRSSGRYARRNNTITPNRHRN